MTYRSVVCQESTRDAARMPSDVSRENELRDLRKPLKAIALCSNAMLPVRAQPVRKATWVAEKASKACMTYGTEAPIWSTLDYELARECALRQVGSVTQYGWRQVLVEVAAPPCLRKRGESLGEEWTCTHIGIWRVHKVSLLASIQAR